MPEVAGVELASAAATLSELAPCTPAHSDDGVEGSSVPTGSDRDGDPGTSAAGVCDVDLSEAAALLFHRLPLLKKDAAEKTAPSLHAKSFRFGNYHRYYGYRVEACSIEDPRLQAMQRQWFVNKRCLDIGCNEGLLTLAIVTGFHAAAMTGIDADELLIKRACRNLRNTHGKASELRGTRLNSRDQRDWNAQIRGLANTWFLAGDFVECKLEAHSYNTITCLSVTKWVHLHGGDAKLKALFAKVSELLVPGGYFILEPQPWISYSRAIKKLEKVGAAHAELDDLALRPEDFVAYLKIAHGFRLLRERGPRIPSKGFDRELLWLKKEK